MARDPHIELRLVDWAEWIRAGRRGDGYPSMSVLHQNWLPPTPGTTPTMKLGTGSATRNRMTHQAIEALRLRLSNTIVLHYLVRLPIDEQAAMLACQVSTVYARVGEAHGLIKAWLKGKQ